MLLDLVGLEAVQARAAALAPGGSTLHDRVRDPRLPGSPGHAATLSEGCADDWAEIVTRLDAGRLLGPDADAGRAWNKTGRDDGVRADVGVVHVGGRHLAYAALVAWDCADGSPDHDVERTVLDRLRATVDQNENVF